MSYEDRDTYGMYKNNNESGPGPALMGADTLIGNEVHNHKGEDLGEIKEVKLPPAEPEAYSWSPSKGLFVSR